MVSDAARKNAARDLVGRTGMPYTAALRHLATVAEPPRPRHQWVLTDEVHAFLSGRTWRGCYFEDLYRWLDRLDPTYECRTCDEPGDARTVASSVVLVVAAYDPDLSPRTVQLFTYKHHAACAPSAVIWAQAADVPSEPIEIGLPASAKPEMVAVLRLTPRFVSAFGETETGDPDTVAALLLAVEVVQDHGQGAAPWLTELQMMLAQDGFGHPDSLGGCQVDEDWSLRIVTDYPSSLAPRWLALRTSPATDAAAPEHLFLSVLDVPTEWAERARDRDRVLVLVGPLPAGPRHEVPELPAELNPEVLADLAEDGTLIGGWVPVAAEPE